MLSDSNPNEQQSLLPTHRSVEQTQSWRGRTAALLKAETTHVLILVLIAIDSACVIADLAFTFLNEDCDHVPSQEPSWLAALSQTSLVITCIFLIELPLTIFAFGASYYLNPLHFFDASIIIATFALEVTPVLHNGKERQLAGLIIILRLWRLIRLAGGPRVKSVERQAEPICQVLRLVSVNTMLRHGHHSDSTRLTCFQVVEELQEQLAEKQAELDIARHDIEILKSQSAPLMDDQPESI